MSKHPITDEAQLKHASARTLQHYERHAEDFWQGTRDHDVDQNRNTLLEAIEGEAPFSILDFGCGPGRDLQVFRGLGHEAIGLDGARNFVDMARAHSGCEVWHQDFAALALPPARFDGVFANAALFHVPSALLPQVLRTLHTTLKPRGVLFASNPRGANEEGFSGERYGCFFDYETWSALIEAAGFVEITHYYRPPGVPREQQPWLAGAWRKV